MQLLGKEHGRGDPTWTTSASLHFWTLSNASSCIPTCSSGNPCFVSSSCMGSSSGFIVSKVAVEFRRPVSKVAALSFTDEKKKAGPRNWGQAGRRHLTCEDGYRGL